MSAEKLVFYALAAVLVLAAGGVVTVRNSVRAALLLVLCFFTSAGLWLLLGAEFLAIALVLVYVGAVMVLWLFVVMMLDIRQSELAAGFGRNVPLAALVGLVIVAEMAALLSTVDVGAAAPANPGGSNAAALAHLLYTDYLYAFEIAGVILLIGIVAAISLTLRGRRENKYVPPSAQVHVRRQDRVRLVRMPARRPDAGDGAA